ncbi:hypothetical protein AGMMS49546_27820 [Spirochaetia bacterium]|nr:hypothetical protein AGMMS49546_27820 [Spirochaetia bacterium]
MDGEFEHMHEILFGKGVSAMGSLLDAADYYVSGQRSKQMTDTLTPEVNVTGKPSGQLEET